MLLGVRFYFETKRSQSGCRSEKSQEDTKKVKTIQKQFIINSIILFIKFNYIDICFKCFLEFQQDKWLQKNEKPFAAKYSFERPSPFLLYEKESRRKVQKKYPSKKRNQHHRTQVS